MLQEDEKHVAQWLSQYGVLPRELVIRLLNMERTRAEKIIRNVKRAGLAVDAGSREYLGADEYASAEPRTVCALWVLLKFIDQVEPTGHIPARYPSQLLFLKGGVGYEIVVLYEGEESYVRLLQPEEGTRYILVLPDIAMAQRLVLPDAPCLFATVEEDIPVPKVHFYSEGDAR